MARAHTYYVAHRDQCLGERSDAEPVCTLLKQTWASHAQGLEPTIVDGASAWIDDSGQIQLRVIKGGTAEVLRDEHLVTTMAALLNA